jgi:hypothetical protein
MKLCNFLDVSGRIEAFLFYPIQSRKIIGAMFCYSNRKRHSEDDSGRWNFRNASPRSLLLNHCCILLPVVGVGCCNNTPRLEKGAIVSYLTAFPEIAARIHTLTKREIFSIPGMTPPRANSLFHCFYYESLSLRFYCRRLHELSRLSSSVTKCLCNVLANFSVYFRHKNASYYVFPVEFQQASLVNLIKDQHLKDSSFSA